MSFTVTAKWQSGKPYKFSMNLNIPSLRRCIANHTPVSNQDHDRDVPYANHIPRQGGELLRAVVDRKNWYVQPGGLSAALTLPGYAASVEQGATIPAVSNRRSMAWNDGSGSVFRWGRAGYYIQPQHFIQRAFYDWMNETGTSGAVQFHRIGSGISAILE